MTQALTLARPYARAAFALARESGSARAAGRDALGFAARVAADPQVAVAARQSALTDADAVDAAVAAMAPSETFARFLALLADNRRLAAAAGNRGPVRGAARRSRARGQGARSRRRRRCRPAELDTIKAALRKRFGRDVEVETAVDASADRRRGDRCRRRRHRRLAARQARPPAVGTRELIAVRTSIHC